MKNLIVFLTLMLSTFAAADSTLLFQTRDYQNYDVLPQFEVNKELGRAWVNIVVSESRGEGAYYSTDNRVKVPGLSYHPETREIVLEIDGQRTVCASFYNRRWTIDGGNSIRLTGRCKLSVKRAIVIEDDGFETYKVPMIQVYFNIE